MKCDFSRSTFQPNAGYSRVLMQQGRVQLDADWNEQVAIGVHQLRALARDLIGEHGGPKDNVGFEIGPGTSPNSLKSGDFAISPGHYYVQGVLCENPTQTTFLTQADLRSKELPIGSYIAYLDVWEREITPVQDATIREVALGGPDTAARARVVWQVRAVEAKDVDLTKRADVLTFFKNWLDAKLTRVRLRARAQKTSPANLDPCQVAPESRYRGLENQLYRVEIQSLNPPTFRWSRDNGSVIFPIVSLVSGDGKTVVRLEHLGRDQHSGLAPGDWVEVADDGSALDPAEKSALLSVLSVDRLERTATLQGVVSGGIGQETSRHPLLRRWDHSTLSKPSSLSNNLGLSVGTPNDWIDLEDGIQIQFESASAGYHVGDYWLIPARTATGNVEWPRSGATEIFQAPHGVTHHYAPLATLQIVNGGALGGLGELRNAFGPLAQPL